MREAAAARAYKLVVENAATRQASRHQASRAIVMGKTPQARDAAATDPTETFCVFRDWNGMYRWTSADNHGRRVKASRFAFPAPSGAFNDIKALCGDDRYLEMAIRDETGP
jgi:hypothetical protein